MRGARLLPILLLGACGPDDGPPVLGVDAGHGNQHTLDGTFDRFGELAREAEGVRLRSVRKALVADTLDGLDLLVVATPWRAAGRRERSDIEAWVRDGGGLFLAADHHPVGAPSSPLAERFGVEVADGWVHDGGRRNELVLSRVDGTLASHPLTDGPHGLVHEVVANDGTSLGAVGGQAVALVPEGWVQLYADADGVEEPVGGQPLIVAVEVGAGRVVVAGEASMWTCKPRDANPELVRGLCEEGREDQAVLVQNLVAWLLGR